LRFFSNASLRELELKERSILGATIMVGIRLSCIGFLLICWRKESVVFGASRVGGVMEEGVMIPLFILVIVGSIGGLIAWSRSAKLRNDIQRIKNSLNLINTNLASLRERLRNILQQEREKEEAAARKAPEKAMPLERVTPAPPEEKPAEAPLPEPVAAKPADSRFARYKEFQRQHEPVAAKPVDSGTVPQESVAREAVTSKEWWSKFEQKAGKRWITWVGVLVLFLSVGLFLKYAFENRWLGPTGRVILGAVAGLVISGAGERFIRRGMRPLGQGLLGGGMAILYLSLFASYALYNLLHSL